MNSGTVIYFSHGGGPLPILGDPSHDKMIAFMKKLPGQFNKPDQVLVISAHWEESIPTVIGNESPPLFYDYYGFAKEAYELKYPVPGNPELASRIKKLLQKNGFSARIDTDRGFDHGLFIPLKMMYPEADIPMTQLSLIRGLAPAEHVSLGKALRPLTEENILIIGSGFSFHNLQAFAWDDIKKEDPLNEKFQNWLIDVCTGDYGETECETLLLEWSKAPYARYCHPREEHLLPLHVCFGISGKKAHVIFNDYILGKRSVAFRW